MLSVKGLSKRYGNIWALKDVDFEVKQGSIVGFLGTNGAGKTTTMDIVCGCLSTDTGSVKINGFDIMEDPIKAKKDIGYLPDEPPLYMDMSVYEYVCYAASLRKLESSKIKQRVNEVLDRLSIQDVKNRIIGNLSKGYKQRVGLAQALVHDPKLLILDEPTEGLDPNQIVQIRELIKSLGADHTILLSSHILSEVQNTCDHIIIINEGSIVQQGSYEELTRRAESGYSFIARVLSDVDSTVKDLEGVSSVSDVKVIDKDNNQLEFYSNCDTVSEDIIKVLLKYGIKEIKENTRSLEDIFLKLTH